MDKLEVNILEFLQELQDIIERAPKVPITGKSMVDKREFNEVIEQIEICIPDQIKKAQWVMSEKDRILGDAQKEYEMVKKETVEMMKYNVENHDIVKEAKIRASEILALAQRDAKAIRIGSREYSNEILSELDRELEVKKSALIQSMQKSFETVAKEIDENMSNASTTIKENIAELRNM